MVDTIPKAGDEIRIRKHLTQRAGMLKNLPARAENNQPRPRGSEATKCKQSEPPLGVGFRAPKALEADVFLCSYMHSPTY